MNRRVGLALASLGVLCLLTSCIFTENFAPVQLTRDGDALAVVFCTDEVVRSVTVRQLAPGAPDRDDWRLVWEAQGPVEVAAGSVVVVNDDAQIFSGVSLFEDPSLVEGYLLNLTADLDDAGDFSVTFTVPPGGLSEGTWLTPRGNLAETPCEVFGGN